MKCFMYNCTCVYISSQFVFICSSKNVQTNVIYSIYIYIYIDSFFVSRRTASETREAIFKSWVI